MVQLLISVLLGVSTLTLLGPQAGEKPTGETEQLVTVTTRPDHREIKPGRELGITLTIKAGKRGAYIPNHFTDWVDTCQTGFVVNIYTQEGASASSTPKSCAGSWLKPGPPAKELLKDYVLLKPGESRSWHTMLTQIRKSPGIYEIKAEYYSHPEGIEEVAAPPEVHGLIVVGHVTAKPVTVRIR
jgi:hypothetical protein